MVYVVFVVPLKLFTLTLRHIPAMFSFYISIKAYHIVLAIISVAIFSLRGILMLSGSPIYQSKWFRLGTPLIDTVLLILGLALAVTAGEVIYNSSWFWEKMVLLVAYIGFGILALNKLTQKVNKAIAFVVALMCAAGLFHAALTKQSLFMLILQ